MTIRPILFSGSMVRALLEGRKSATRRVLKPQPSFHAHFLRLDGIAAEFCLRYHSHEQACHGSDPIHVPYAPGDRFWVRETWAVVPSIGGHEVDRGALYKADGAGDYAGSWRPSIFMPRWASRLTLEVTGVKVERVQEISEADAVAEGIRQDKDGAGTFIGREGPGKWVTPWPTAVEAFADLWDSINAKRGFGWDANPWVVAVTFDVHRANIDALPQEDQP